MIFLHLRIFLVIAVLLFGMSSSTNAYLGPFFDKPQFIAVGDEPLSLAIEDLNGDRILDIVTANLKSGTLSILFGDGNGAFPRRRDLESGRGCHFVTVADFNGDGWPDLASANMMEHDIALFLGDGRGNFRLTSRYTVDLFPVFVGTGNFDKDPALDIVTVNVSGSVSILLNDGKGNLGRASHFSVSGDPHWAEPIDINRDGNQDLAIVNTSSATITLLYGDGAGHFLSALVLVPVGFNPQAVLSGDFNSDRRLDLVVTNSGSRTFTVLLADGLGGFRKDSFAGGDTPFSVAMGDFNSDTALDLVVTENGSKSVVVWTGDGVGGFGKANNISVDFRPGGVKVGDFDRDRRPDIAVLNIKNGAVAIFLQR